MLEYLCNEFAGSGLGLGVFLWILGNVYVYLFWRTSANGCFWRNWENYTGNGREFWATTGYDTITFLRLKSSKNNAKFEQKCVYMKFFKWFYFLWKTRQISRGRSRTLTAFEMKLFVTTSNSSKPFRVKEFISKVNTERELDSPTPCVTMIWNVTVLLPLFATILWKIIVPLP